MKLPLLSMVLTVAVAGLSAGLLGCASSDRAESLRTLPPQPDGDRLVRLLKTIADAGLLTEPERMAKALNIAMTFETKVSSLQAKSCDDGGSYKSFVVTEGKVGDSWFKPGPEGHPDMKVPGFFINPAFVVGAPTVSYALYRTAQCGSPDRVQIEASLSFGNLSSFSCLTPDRLERLIGAKHYMATDGVSISSYSPPAKDAYDVDLAFTFRAMAPCAISATIRQESRRARRP